MKSLEVMFETFFKRSLAPGYEPSPQFKTAVKKAFMSGAGALIGVWYDEDNVLTAEEYTEQLEFWVEELVAYRESIPANEKITVN